MPSSSASAFDFVDVEGFDKMSVVDNDRWKMPGRHRILDTRVRRATSRPRSIERCTCCSSCSSALVAAKVMRDLWVDE